MYVMHLCLCNKQIWQCSCSSFKSCPPTWSLARDLITRLILDLENLTGEWVACSCSAIALTFSG